MSHSMSHEELVAVWDHLLMYFLLWLEGHTIAQTCLCCIYLQDLEGLVRPIPLLGVFLDAFLVICRRARGAILRAGVYDDEDFLPNLFGLDLEASVYSSNPKEVRKRLDQEIGKLRKGGHESPQTLIWRLEFIGEYMFALAGLEAETAEGKKGFGSPPDRLTACLGLLEKLDASCSVAPPEVLRCFDPSINRRLLVPGPPRTVEPIPDPHVAFGMWTSHVHELILCGSLTAKSLTQLVDGAITHKGEPNVLPRSIAQLCVSEDKFLRRIMLDSLSSFLFPREALQHCKKPVEAFLDRSESVLGHIMRLAHANSARRFRRLAHVFADLNALQHEAWRLDDDLRSTFGANLHHPRPCWLWIMEHSLRAMLAKLFLGFELELYEPGELHMIYWYCDYLYSLRVYNLNELHHAKEQLAGTSAKKKRPKEHPPAGRTGLRPKNPPSSLLLMEATQTAIRGLFRLMSFCLRRGILSSPEAVNQGLAQRFVLRFRSLERFRLPHLPSFLDFEQSTLSAQAPTEGLIVLEAAQSSFAESAQILERIGSAKDKDAATDTILDGAKALRRVVVANQLAITQLLKSPPVEKGLKVTVANSHHPHFISVQILKE